MIKMNEIKTYDIQPRLLSAIDIMYQNTRAKIMPRTPDGDTNFVIKAEYHIFFTIILDYIMRKVHNGRVDLS